jgi:hypothetical protein
MRSEVQVAQFADMLIALLCGWMTEMSSSEDVAVLQSYG